MFPLFELTFLHGGEQFQVFLYGSVPVRTWLARFVDGPTVFTDRLLVQAIHVRITILNQSYRILVKLIEIIGSKIEVLSPVVSEPLYRLFNRFHIFHALRLGIGVIKPEMTLPIVLPGKLKIEHNGLGMADVKISIGFRGKSCYNVCMVPVLEIFFNYLVDKRIPETKF